MSAMNPWDKATKRLLRRPDTLTITGTPNEVYGTSEPLLNRRTRDCELERGVNYFVLALERMGATTMWTCEGHPTGFYIVFHADYRLAHDIEQAGYFHVEVERQLNCFSIRLPGSTAFDEKSRRSCLRGAASAWEQKLTQSFVGRYEGGLMKGRAA